MSKRVCSQPGCPRLVDPGAGRCDEHRKAAERSRSKRRPELKYYGTRRHKVWRAAILERDPICVLCRDAPATHADHFPVSLADLLASGQDPDQMGNGRGLCHPCHSRETARLQPGGWADQ